MKKVSKIVLYEERIVSGAEVVDTKDEWVSVAEDGDLRLDVNDWGKTPQQFWGDSDYEYWEIVDKEWKDTVLLLLIKERFKRFSDFRDWLKNEGVPSTSGSWV